MSQKLYTEEQVIDMLNGSKMEKHLIYKFLKKYYTPIELPSDEEIDKKSFERLTLAQISGFRLGAKYVIDKILNK